MLALNAIVTISKIFQVLSANVPFFPTLEPTKALNSKQKEYEEWREEGRTLPEGFLSVAEVACFSPPVASMWRDNKGTDTLSASLLADRQSYWKSTKATQKKRCFRVKQETKMDVMPARIKLWCFGVKDSSVLLWTECTAFTLSSTIYGLKALWQTLDSGPAYRLQLVASSFLWTK